MKKALLLMGALTVATAAWADSFWLHNGSLMRLQADGNYRVFSYEEPSARMRSAGVTPGTILFEGERRGNRYYGQARVFSRYCAGELVYDVQGTVVTEQKVVMTGTRPRYNTQTCRPNGRVTDRLVFTYQYSD
ncbi:hypothetical protein L1281_001213 [Neisseria sp. HSC-16F19]|nr:hypothetical protein [Neisseria sp. HSC-16F19]MCP2040630.1 hypothetical protein [Neisseria sp. HSC-16F19]